MNTSHAIQDVKDKFKNNDSWLSVLVGRTGSGKSWSAIKIASWLDPNFSIDNIVFTSGEFLERIESKDLRKGSMIIFDEAGISFGARDFYTDVNKALSAVLQSMRALNLGTIFTVPNISFVDKHARKLVHSVIETICINRQEGYTEVKWKNVWANPIRDMKDPYYIYPTHLEPNGFIRQETRTRIYKADKDLLDAYEAKKMDYLHKTIARSAEINRKEESKKISNNEIVNILREEIGKTTRPCLRDIQARWGVGKDRAAFCLYEVYPKRKNKQWDDSSSTEV